MLGELYSLVGPPDSTPNLVGIQSDFRIPESQRQKKEITQKLLGIGNLGKQTKRLSFGLGGSVWHGGLLQLFKHSFGVILALMEGREFNLEGIKVTSTNNKFQFATKTIV